MLTIPEQLQAASEAARAKSREAGPGPVGILWNTLATQAAMLAATAMGIEAGAQAPGVTEKPTSG